MVLNRMSKGQYYSSNWQMSDLMSYMVCAGELTGAKEIDIAATLEHLRDQRMHMVRTKAQFEFVLKAVAEEVHAILRSLQGSAT